MGRVARALMVHELLERARDRWVLVISMLFALLATGVSVYARGAEAGAAQLAGPSLVTLSSLLVPLVALVLGHDAVVGERERNTLGLLLSLPVSKLEVVLAKFIGRMIALAGAVGIGLGAAVLFAPEGHGQVLGKLIFPTMLLGWAFLAIGVLISTVVKRQITAASFVVSIWFVAVFFYDLGLLALLVATDGAVSNLTVANLVVANPAGMFRLEMMSLFAGPSVLESLGMTIVLPKPWALATMWVAWIVGPVVLSGLLLSRQKVMR